MSYRTLFALFMSVIYVLAGLVLLFTDMLRASIPLYRPILGGVLVGYGLLRAGMWWNRYRKEKGQAS